MLAWLIDDPSAYVSRGTMILNVLSGDGSADLLPGRPDIAASQSDWDKGERYDPEIDFDLNSFSRVDKFDGVEVGQGIIDSELDAKAKESSSKTSSSSGSGFEEK